ncbi:MAG: site-2 protease family protein [Acidimicrobiales bacterium]
MPIRLHWSFPLVVLFVVTPTGGRFTALSFFEGLGWVAALFVCVVIHELSHSFVARRRGFVVRDIVLLPIGGASEISGLPGAPADELAIASAGPLASIALALVFALFAYATGARLWPPTLFAGALASRLMWLNALLAGFNLLPAIPMDGGRVLRALLARKRGDLSATVLAVRIGRLVGFAMVILGLRFDLWLCLIGLFVVVGAGGEQRAAAVRSATGGLKVLDVMVHDPATLEVSFPLSVVAPFLQATPGRVLPVVERGRYVGLIAAAHLPGPAGALLVGDATDRLAPALAPGDPLYPVATEVLLGARRRAAAVLEDGQVVGVLYAAHLEAALRRATSGLGASSTRR